MGNGHETTVDDSPVDHYRARAALPFAAALFRSGQAKLFTQHIQQPLHRIRVDSLRLGVDGEIDLSFLSHGSFVTPRWFNLSVFAPKNNTLSFWVSVKTRRKICRADSRRSSLLAVNGDEFIVVIERLHDQVPRALGLVNEDYGGADVAITCCQRLVRPTVHRDVHTKDFLVCI